MQNLQRQITDLFLLTHISSFLLEGDKGALCPSAWMHANSQIKHTLYFSAYGES